MKDYTPEELAQGQLDAYNAHDLDRFCSFFSEDISIFDAHTRALMFSGMESFRARYTKTFSNPDLHCTLVHRMVQDNIVIDQESVVGLGSDVVTAIAIYHTKENKIHEVYFY